MRTLDYILVDGYNVLNSWEILRRYKKDLEFARHKLVDMLCDFANYRGVKVKVVFDAHKQCGSQEKEEDYKGVKVVYTKEGEIADCYIEREAFLLGKKYKVGVVTSDNLEQSIAFQMGAIRITPSELLEEVNITKKTINVETKLSYVEEKNMLENCIKKDILEELEKMRRKP